MPGAGPVRYETDGTVAIVTISNPPVNALCHAVRSGLLDAVTRAEADEKINAIVLLGDGDHFIAGADIREFGTPPRAPFLPDVCNRIETSDCVIVAAIHGACLGGGLEIALAAHHRTADVNARQGLPEVNLGLIPGAGGTQRLPRLAGTAEAIDLIATGRQMSASEALRLGIVDALHHGNARSEGLTAARELLAAGAGKRRTRNLPRPAAINWSEQASKTVRSRPGQLAPKAALDAVRASTEMPFEAALAEERRIFTELVQSDQRDALVHVFLAERATAKLPELEQVAARPVRQVGVVGGGTMGAGIATSVLLGGLPVVLVETSEAAAQSAYDRIAQNLEGALRRGKLTSADYEIALGEKLTLATSAEALAAADVIIEAVFEDMAVKRAVFTELDKVSKSEAVLATNTSYLDINEIADAVAAPGRVIGLHFFSPAHVMKLLEIVVPERARPDAVATGFALAKRLGKRAVRAGVGDGFIGNRILSACRAAADHMVISGASPQQLDEALEDYGFAMGPFAVADLAGLDIGRANRQRMRARGDGRVGIAGFADRLCEAGHLGRKTGRGYYLYGQDVAGRSPNPHATNLIERERRERAIEPRDYTPDMIVARYMAAMVNEACHVLDEGIARRPLDVDVILVAGYGFPRFRGGPFKWADQKGLSALLAETERFAREEPLVWKPAPLLERMVSSRRLFSELNDSGAGSSS